MTISSVTARTDNGLDGSVLARGESEALTRISEANSQQPALAAEESVKRSNAPNHDRIADENSAFAYSVKKSPSQLAPGSKMEKADVAMRRKNANELAKLPEFSQTFANVASETHPDPEIKAGAPTPVLANFRVEQAGRQLLVVDRDGSTYMGEVDSAARQVVVGTFDKKGAVELKEKDHTAQKPPAAGFSNRESGGLTCFASRARIARSTSRWSSCGITCL